MGEDPGAKKKEAKEAAAVALAHSFGHLSKELIEKKRKEGRAEITIEKMEWIFKKVEPDLGQRQIQDITTPQIVAVLRKEEAAGNLKQLAVCELWSARLSVLRCSLV